MIIISNIFLLDMVEMIYKYIILLYILIFNI